MGKRSRWQGRHGVISMITAVGVALLTVACGSAAPGKAGDSAPSARQYAYGEPSGKPERRAVSVAVLPVVDFGPLYYAKSKGFFAAEGLDVTLRPVQGAAAAVPALLSGDLQFSIANLPSFVLAVRQGVGLRLVANGSRVSPEVAAVVVPADSPVRDISDIEGRTIAVSLLNSVPELAIRAVLRRAGLDFDKVRFVEIPLPDTVAALTRGSVDAAFLTEPFMTQGKAAGIRPIAWPWAGEMANLPVAGYMTTAEFATANPFVIGAFQRALRKASMAFQAEAVVRDFVPSFTQLPVALAQQMALPVYEHGVNVDQPQQIADHMVRLGMIPAPIDLRPFVGNE